MNQDVFKGFLSRLIKTTNKKVYAIADNLPVHHGLLLAEWREKNTDKIKLFFLPSYAPNLNPVEYLNNNLKYDMERSGYSKTGKEIQHKAMRTMRSIQAKKNRIVDFFEHPDVQYAKFHE
jgi:transposase